MWNATRMSDYIWSHFVVCKPACFSGSSYPECFACSAWDTSHMSWCHGTRITDSADFFYFGCVENHPGFRLLKQEGQSSCRTGIMKLCVPVVCWLKWCSTGMPLKHSWFCPQDSSPTCGHLLQVTSFPVIFQSILSIKPLKSSQRSLLTVANEHFVHCDKNVISF